MVSRQATEHRARRYRTRLVGDRVDVDGCVPFPLEHVDAFEELIEAHWPKPYGFVAGWLVGVVAGAGIDCCGGIDVTGRSASPTDWAPAAVAGGAAVEAAGGGGGTRNSRRA